MLEFRVVPDPAKAFLLDVAEVPVLFINKTAGGDAPVPVDVGRLPQEEAFVIGQGAPFSIVIQKETRGVTRFAQGAEEDLRPHDPALYELRRMRSGEGLILGAREAALLEAELGPELSGEPSDLGHLVEIEFEDEELQDDFGKEGPFLPLHTVDEADVAQHFRKVASHAIGLVGLLGSPIQGDHDLFQATLYESFGGPLIEHIEVSGYRGHEAGVVCIGDHFRKQLVHQGLAADIEVRRDRVVPEIVDGLAKGIHAHHASGPASLSLPDIAQGAFERARTGYIEKEHIRDALQFHFSRPEFPLVSYDIDKSGCGFVPREGEPCKGGFLESLRHLLFQCPGVQSTSCLPRL